MGGIFQDFGLSDDPDMISKPGIYHIYAGTSHAPENRNGYIILYFVSLNRHVQLAIINDQTDNYYIRTKSSEHTEYSKWRKIMTEDIDNLGVFAKSRSDHQNQVYGLSSNNVRIELIASMNKLRVIYVDNNGSRVSKYYKLTETTP